MRTRFIKPNVRNRIMVRGPFTEDTVHLSKYLISSGYKPATLVQFWKHVLFWKWGAKKARKATPPPEKK